MAILINKQQRDMAAKKVEDFLEQQKQWFPVLDLYHAVLELQDQLRGEPVPAGYDFWAKKVLGNCSALSKILFVLHARKVILQKIGGGPMPGEADMPDLDPDWLRFWERSITEMSDEELNDAFDEFQEERYYFRKSCRRGEMDDAGRRENLRMELWGVAARHINGKRAWRKEKAERIARFLFPRVMRKRFLKSETPKSTQELLDLRDEIFCDLGQGTMFPWAAAICLRVVLAELRTRGAAGKPNGVDVSVPVAVWRDINGIMGGFYRNPEAALQFAVRTARQGLGISLNLRSGKMTCATEMLLCEAQQLFFPRTHELEDEERADYWVDEHEVPCCPGCRDSQANQLAHMDPGGCLYTDCD